MNQYEQVLMNNVSGSLSANFACNAAGDPFDPAPTFIRSNLVIDVSFATKASNVTSALIGDILEKNNSVNSADFELPKVTIKKEQGKVYGFTLREGTWVDPLFGYKYDYYDVNFQFEVNKKGWDLEILNAGFNEIKDGKKSRINVFNPETGLKEPCVTPQLLNTDGSVISSTSGTPNYCKFVIYDKEDWSSLKTFITDRD
jgi:hypothetical protein